MQTVIDLNYVRDHLTNQHRKAKEVIRQLAGYSSVHRDLAQADRLMDLFYRWHVLEVLPTRQNYVDNGDAAMMGHGLFTAALNSLCRALDDGGSRSKIDFKPAFRDAGLEAAAAAILLFGTRSWLTMPDTP